MRKRDFNVFRRRQFNTLKIVIPILVFVICLTICVLKSSIALGSKEKDEVVVVTIKNHDVNLDLIGRLYCLKTNLLTASDEINELRRRNYRFNC